MLLHSLSEKLKQKFIFLFQTQNFSSQTGTSPHGQALTSLLEFYSGMFPNSQTKSVVRTKIPQTGWMDSFHFIVGYFSYGNCSTKTLRKSFFPSGKKITQLGQLGSSSRSTELCLVEKKFPRVCGPLLLLLSSLCLFLFFESSCNKKLFETGLIYRTKVKLHLKMSIS